MQQQRTRAASFLLVISWMYLLLSLGMIAFALYQLTDANITLSFSGAMDAVFLIIGGALGFVAGIFGLVSKELRRCRIMGLVLLAIAAVPLAVNLIAGEPFRTYWKNIAVMVLPFLYLLAALIKRSGKKAEAVPAAPQFTPAPQPADRPESAQEPVPEHEPQDRP